MQAAADLTKKLRDSHAAAEGTKLWRPAERMAESTPLSQSSVAPEIWTVTVEEAPPATLQLIRHRPSTAARISASPNWKLEGPPPQPRPGLTKKTSAESRKLSLR